LKMVDFGLKIAVIPYLGSGYQATRDQLPVNGYQGIRY
jgi:hypothetical protein